MMTQVYEAHDEVYPWPTGLRGTLTDNVLIIPDRGLELILSLQLQQAIKQRPLTTGNLTDTLRKADGKAGPGFCRSILKEERLDLMNETSNKRFTDTEGNKLRLPKSKDTPETHYQFLRSLVQARHGLWSDQAGVMNLVGLRRVIDAARKTAYNDTVAVCWQDAQGQKHCELHIATTEPGNRKSSRELLPQTLTVVPGFHNVRQPGGRTHNVMKEGSDQAVKRGFNDEKPTWCPGDSTMNFHQGGNNFTYPGRPGRIPANTPFSQFWKWRRTWLMKYGVDSKIQQGLAASDSDRKTYFEINKVLSEIYLILSRHGQRAQNAAYSNLEALSKHPPIKNLGLQDGKITVQQAGQAKRVIDVDHVRRRTVRIWFDGRRNKATKRKIYQILEAISDYSPEQIKSWRNFTEAQVIGVIKDEHINNIVNLQIAHVPTISKGVDGIAGNDSYAMVMGLWPTVTQAKTDKTRIDTLFEALSNLPLRPGLTKALKTLSINTLVNRTNVLEKTKHLPERDLDIIENVTVGNYSAGCQVFYDTEVFYKFWSDLLNRSAEVGQLRWYYTLVDSTHFSKAEDRHL